MWRINNRTIVANYVRPLKQGLDRPPDWISFTMQGLVHTMTISPHCYCKLQCGREESSIQFHHSAIRPWSWTFSQQIQDQKQKMFTWVEIVFCIYKKNLEKFNESIEHLNIKSVPLYLESKMYEFH